MIINNLRVPVTKLRDGDQFIAIHQLPTNPPSAHAVVAEVRDVTHYEDDGIRYYTVRYRVTDKPSGMCYGSDVTYSRRDHVTVITTN
jgi:hypothetical protein